MDGWMESWKMMGFKRICKFASDSRYVQNCRLVSLWDECASLRKSSQPHFHLWLDVGLASSHCILDVCIDNSFCTCKIIVLAELKPCI